MKTGPISTEELTTSMTCMVKWVQRESFQGEHKRLSKQEEVDNNSKLIQLKPILDSYGIIRVGGRLDNMKATENKRHPVIIPTHHHLTTLIIRDCHLKNLHSGLTLTLATIQQQFWIPRGRDTVRHFIRKCVTCRKCRAATCEQLMGNLPPARVNPSRPFQHTGIDFAGPYQIRISRGRGVKCQKCYFCIFVCFATKAVHLEVVMDMTSESFIATFKRFVSRRGVPSDVYSDCGTNFVGAEKELRDLYKNVQSNTVSNQFSEKGIKWHFNVPSSPHKAGLWEAVVKSVKHHLRRVVGKLTMTLEQFGTLLCVIEACLNSRPLCAISSDPLDLEPLTPGHFLVGTALTAIPEKDTTQINSNRLSYWQQTQQLAQRFWKRWSAEYVTSLQQRFKWVSKRANLHVNDLVVIKDEQLPPMKWKMGRIIETHAGADGCVRTVTLKTTNGTIKRPIVKLSPILFHNE